MILISLSELTPNKATALSTQEVDERNAKLLQTLSEATDMLAKADEMQVPGAAYGRST